MYSFNFLSKEFNLDQIKLAYNGEINSALTESLLDLLVHFFDVHNIPKKSQNKLLRICVEIIQNITKHKGKEAGQNSAIYITNDDKTISLTSCNALENKDKDRITKRFEKLNKLSVDEFKEKYRTALKDSVFDEKGGAGIGLIDIAYRSGAIPKINFESIPKSDEFLFRITTPLYQLS